MHFMYFTERPYREVPEDEVIKNRSFFGVPNSLFDREVGARLYNEYLDENCYAEEVGFDGVMLNEHHGTPFCMGAVMNVEAAILARITKRVRIVLLGNPLPTLKNWEQGRRHPDAPAAAYLLAISRLPAEVGAALACKD